MKTNRALNNIKANKTIVGTGQPRINEGSEGDLCIRKLREGIFLFAKYGNLWYKVGQLEVHQPKHSNPTVLNAMSGASGNSGQTTKGGLGNTGIGTGAKFFLDTIKTRLGIKGKNYIQSGTSAANLGRDSTNSDISFMNLALDNEPILILSGIKGSDNTPETITFKSNLEDATGQIFHFLKERNGVAGTDSDVIGDILFSGQNKEVAPVEHQFARIRAQVVSGVEDQEKGQLLFAVAEYNGTVTTGLSIVGQAADGEVDVTIGAGISSVTTVSGDLAVTGNDITFPGNGNIDAGGHCSINVGATKDIFLTENSGTYTPSAANHATPKHYVDAMVYPGQILGYTYNHPSSLIYHLLTTSMTVEANTHLVTFDTPPSEKVEITVSAFFDRSSTSDVGVYMGLSLNATYSQLGEEWAYDFNSGIGNSDDEADDRYENVKFVLQAAELEAVGVSNTVYIGLASTDASAVYLRYGHAGGRTYPPMIIKAVALPSSINEE